MPRHNQSLLLDSKQQEKQGSAMLSLEFSRRLKRLDPAQIYHPHKEI